MSEWLIGADEVGLGAWCGHLVCCAVAVRKDWTPPVGLNDSKKLTKAKREKLYNILRDVPRALSWMSAEAIDAIGIREALISAHTSAIRDMLSVYPDTEIILDGDVALPDLPQARCIPKADGTFAHVMAASIIAKVTRDWEMTRLDKQYPGYALAKNAGYGTPQHQEGLAKLGPSAIHRKSYAPIKALIKELQP
jgi:ribonuclease HII